MSTSPEQQADPNIADMLSQLSVDEKLSLLAGKSLFKTRAIRKLSLPSMKLVDGPRGVGFHCSFKRATAFPTGIALGASWSPKLAEEFGVAIANEVIAVGGNVALGPAVNICRTPLNGRTFEYLTEDPLLNSQLAVPMVKGIQSQGVAACIKHFAANNQERGRAKVSVKISERALREIYLPVFEAAVREADVWSVMAAYNGVNGIACCENKNLLQNRLRDEWGFSGFVVSDWWAARRTESGASCMRAGLNLEMPGGGSVYRKSRLKKEFKQGDFTEQELDSCLEPLLRIWSRTTLDKLGKGARNTKAHQQLAYRMAAESITLLKNSKALLPLGKKPVRIAVVGERAKLRNCRPLYGGSAGVWSPYEITPLDGIRQGLPAGCELIDDTTKADAAIVVVGLGHRLHGDCEGKDRHDMKLPKEQEQLIKDTAAVNANTIVLLVSGSPLEMTWADDVSAIVAAWYPGMEGGRAIADVLFGRVNPSGKLPVSFPAALADYPAHSDSRGYPGEEGVVHYDEDIFVGYRHFDRAGTKLLFPFGHGLSYTTFEYSELNCSVSGDTCSVTATIKSTGTIAGAEVVQLYIAPQDSRIARPDKELKAFEKIELQANESKQLRFELSKRDFSYWCEQSNEWRADSGRYEICIAASSQDIRLREKVQFL